MDPASIAALAVSIMAMTIAFAQALQQYLITGQLIRMCDSVVYGKLPGQGKRIWEYAQFRFRVVYSIPQISLRPSLWLDSLPQHPCYSSGHSSVPDLRHSVKKYELDCSADGQLVRQRRSQYSATPGEASWVSFSRVAQFASENDLVYDLVDGDADRCPSDLPVVPMQVSMRDIVVMALMAGLRCTDTSFDKKTLCMEGSAGTITSSSHPLLGATIHFTPRNRGQPPGLRIGGGSVNPLWMTRLWDTVIVAGRPFALRERMYYETYEGYDWVTLSNDRTIATVYEPKESSRSSSLASRLRRRRNSGSSRRPVSAAAQTSGPDVLTFINKRGDTDHGNSDMSASIHSSRHDGDWAFESHISESGLIPGAHSLPAATTIHSDKFTISQAQSMFQKFKTHFSKQFKSNREDSKDVDHDPFSIDVEGLEKKEKLEQSHPTDARHNYHSENDIQQGRDANTVRQSHLREPFPGRRGRKLLDGFALQQYIEEKRVPRSSPPWRKPLFLTWPTGEEQEEAQAELRHDIHDVEEGFGDWRDAYLEMRQEHRLTYVERWRNVLYQRQRSRETRAKEDEWEITDIISNKSASRRSSSAPVRTSKRLSLNENRSLSRGRKIRRNTDNQHDHLATHHDSRTSYRNSQNFKDFDERSFSRTTSDTNSLRKVREQGRFMTQGADSATYGNSPILIPQNSIGPIENEQDPPINGSVRDERNQKRTVGFRLDDDSNQSPQSPRENCFERHDTSPGRVTGRVTTREDSMEEDAVNQGASSKAHMTKETANLDEDPILSSILPQKETFLDKPEEVEEQDDDPTDSSRQREDMPHTPKGILKAPREHFPERHLEPREGIAPLKDAGKKGIPWNARWTKIDRRLVNPEALELGNERYEERPDYVIVLRVLSKEEIEKYAEVTQEIRNRRYLADRERQMYHHRKPAAPRSNDGSMSSGSSEDYHLDRLFSRSPSPSRMTAASPDTFWSNEAILDSGSSSRLSESPSRTSETSFEMLDHPYPRDNHRRDSTLSEPSYDMTEAYPQSRRHSPISIAEEYQRVRSAKPTQPGSDQNSGRQDEEGQRRGLGPSERENTARFNSPFPIGPRSMDSSDDDISSDVSSDDYTRPTEKVRSKASVDWFWICQADVLPGYFATPWQGEFSESICFGAILTMLKVLEYFTDDSTLRYVDKQPHCERWAHEGRSTHPSYAINAMGGIIVSGKYPRARFVSLETQIPPVELLRSYEHQVNQTSRASDDSRIVVERLCELMALDSWLAFCGRLPEICDGRNNLLRRMPSLIQKIMTDFEYEFRNLDRTALEGGLQIINEMGGLLIRELERQGLSDAEQLFATIAILRSAKMALCVVQGPSTAKLREILLQDVQVYLV